MSDNETLAAVLAEMRGIVNSIQNRLQPLDTPTIFGKPIAVYFAELADRLEAVAKRERGNAVKMREALKRMVVWFNEGGFDEDAADEMDAMVENAESALAEPPRNCDRFGGDIDKLREACARERGLNPEEDFPDVFPDWLLAPSTAKESGVRK